MKQQTAVPYTPEEVDAKYKQFVIHCFELLLMKMLPHSTIGDITPVAVAVEQTMTEVADLSTHNELRDKLYALCPFSEENAKTLHMTVCCFAPNIMGVLMQKGIEIANGTYTPEIFFSQSTPS